jgi:hypothetical protein
MDTNDILRRLYDVHRIQQLAIEYAIAMDGRDLERVVGLFVPDVRTAHGVGRAALGDQLDSAMRTSRLSVMSVSNHLITFDSDDGGADDLARGVVYCRAVADFDGTMVEQLIRYDDRYAVVDGAWKYRTRLHRLWWGVEMAERPLDQPPANWPTHHTGVGTLPDELPSWTEFWSNR